MFEHKNRTKKFDYVKLHIYFCMLQNGEKKSYLNNRLKYKYLKTKKNNKKISK